MSRVRLAVAFYLFSLAPTSSFAQPQKMPVELLSIEGVKVYAKANNIDTIEQLMKHLPDVLLNNYVLMEDSHSRQQPSSIRKPRIILFLPDGSFFMGIATDGRSDGYDDAEMIENRSDSTWRLGALRLNTKSNKHGDIHAAGSAMGEKRSCIDCHGSNSRPIWGTYPKWPGAFANGAGHDLTTDQAQAINDALDGTSAYPNPRLQELNWSKEQGWKENDDFNLPDRRRGLNNEGMNDALGARHIESLWKRVANADHAELFMLAVMFDRSGFGTGINGVPEIRTKLTAIVNDEWRRSGLDYLSTTTADKSLLLLGLDPYDDLYIPNGLHELVNPEREQSQFSSAWFYIAIRTGDLLIVRFLDHLLQEHPELHFGEAMVTSKFEYSGAYPSIFAYHRDNVHFMRELDLPDRTEFLRTQLAPTIDLRYEHMFTKSLQMKIMPKLIEFAEDKIDEYEAK